MVRIIYTKTHHKDYRITCQIEIEDKSIGETRLQLKLLLFLPSNSLQIRLRKQKMRVIRIA